MNASTVRELIHDENLKPSAKVVGVHMVFHPDAQMAVEIAEAVRLHRATVGDALVRLTDDGWVSLRHHLWKGVR